MSISFERAGMLMSIIKLSAELGPREANSISAMAVMELREMDGEARQLLADRAKKAQEDAAVAEAQAKADAEEEAVEDDSGDEDPDVKTPTPSKTDQVAINNMRRA